MNQVMLAILDQNPQAFIDGNVNQLRRDATLEMPSTDAIANIDASEADRRMQAQMMAWQPVAQTEQVPVVSDDALAEVIDESEPTPVEDVDDSNYRLEVVPPEGETADDVPAVSEAEIEEASSRLTDLEDQFYAEDLDNEAMYRQVDEIRGAIEARDMAGLAVANEELASLEARLRTAREERARAEEMAAQEQALAEADAEETVDGAVDEVDEVDEYFDGLEEELGVGQDGAIGPVADDDSMLGEDNAEEQLEMAESPVTPEMDEAASNSPAQSEPETSRPITVVGSDREGGSPVWLLALIGAALILIAGIGLFVWNMLRNRSNETSPGEPALDIDELRSRVHQDPDNLDAHLALLNGLAMTDDEDRFSDALDSMYAHVDDDNDPRWQSALNLAVMNAPDHPLLTPREVTGTGAEDSMDGLDDQTREMLGILERPEDEPSARSDHDEDEAIDSTLELTGASEESDGFFDETSEDSAEDTLAFDDSLSADDGQEDDDNEMAADDSGFDLAALSDRLDEEESPADGSESRPDSASADLDSDGSDLSDDESLSDSDAEHPALEPSSDDDLDLDFEFSSEEGLESDGDALSLDGLEAADGDSDNEFDNDSDKEDGASPADTLDLSGESASNDTVRMDPDELNALDVDAEDDGDAADEGDASATVRADDTLDLVSNSDLDFEDVGDREMEAFLTDGDEIVDGGDDDDLMADGEAASILDTDESDSDDDDQGEPVLSDDDADVKLDLAQAYLSMDDSESARTLLEEIISGGSKAKRARARELLGGI